ncbi:sensor histidine kinase [Cupriavidus gilardii CR3]|uniref:histidine kinase n=1 Tax=Cupriavidus gilardii TaxID=82541 RepID=A0A849BIE3_9BURK|nr:ATP-binding protein [Cupriavidus gilardii]ALD92190.1 sensor histidine kinase [Cupriavidus gilardii CR3]MCT9014876.1 ATP-binding protein [Cupriavidus gilardii]MCT9053288.1 ATP-binding protein [Cupriavidus gilardii]NNH12317.1 response regulator [Cupriavidus gilardii]WNG67373.1 ATP-binding protein [Cupriavidus gilardii]
MSAVIPGHLAKPDTSHMVRFYDEDSILVADVREFADEALRCGGSAILIATEEHLDALLPLLRGLGPGRDDRPWYTGNLITLPAQATLDRFMVDGWPDEQRFLASVGELVAAEARRAPPLHAFGEMVALLCEQGMHDAALRLEELWNDLIRRHGFRLLCAYPHRVFASDEKARHFRCVCDVHTHFYATAAGKSADIADSALRAAVWQQKALALENEVKRLREAESTLRRREIELTDFLDNAAEGVHRVAADGTILWANRAELEMLGYRYDEYVGRPITDFHVDAPVIEHILDSLKAGETLYDQPARLRCKDGSIKPVLIHSNGCFEDGKLRYTRCFTRDASDRVARELAEQQRERLLRELERASQAKDEFLAMLGHELRNPLSPIVTALQLMRMRGSTETQRERAIIERQVDHLVRLIDDLLDVSRITRGNIELKVETVQLADVLAKAVEMASRLLEQRSHRLTVDVDRSLAWQGDPVRLAQAVANLLTNAARYTDIGGEIRLSAWRDDPVEDIAEGSAAGTIVIRVRDNGIGIAADMLPHLFDLFYQGPRKIDRQEGGLGIGLALVKNLVELHGGSVSATSAGPAQGSEFTIRLPAVASAELVAAAHRDEPAAVVAAADARRVLLVDDNVDSVQALAQLLTAYGHHVQVVYDPVSALRVVERFAPDVAVLDIGLPVMDGYELVRRLRETLGDRPCRFVALTGYGQDTDRDRSKAAGFSQHLVKPVSPDALLRLIEDTGQ